MRRGAMKGIETVAPPRHVPIFWCTHFESPAGIGNVVVQYAHYHYLLR
jgi:hypothetical protein